MIMPITWPAGLDASSPAPTSGLAPDPLVDPTRAKVARRLAGVAAGSNGIFRRGFNQLLANQRRTFGLDRREPYGAAPHALSSERKGRGHLATRTDAPGRQYWGGGTACPRLDAIARMPSLAGHQRIE